LQNVAPVGAVGGVHVHLGCTGSGPLSDVFGQRELGPQPKFLPERIRFTSSSQSGPFSVCHGRPVLGSKVNPNELRWPYENA
jgi:hypothetical protein